MAKPRPWWLRYAVATLAVVLGFLAREAITPSVGRGALPFIFFFPALSIAAWYGGLGPGIFAVLLSMLLANWFFVEPFHSLTPGEPISLLAFLIASGVILAAIQMSHRARRRLVEEQRKSQETYARLAAIVQYSGDAIITKDLNGVIQTWNAGAERLFGYQAAEVIGKPITLLFPPGRLQEEEQILSRLRQGQAVQRLETVRIAKDQRGIPVAVSISPIKDPAGHVTGASSILHDITEMVAAREVLAREKEMLDTTLAKTPFMLNRCSRDLHYQFVSRAYADMLGRKPEEIAGKPILEVIGEEGFRTLQPYIEQVLRGTRVDYEKAVHFKGVGERLLRVNYTPDTDQEGNVTGWLASIVDLTAHKRVEDESRRLATIIAATPDFVAIARADGQITYMNSAGRRLLGLPEEADLKKHNGAGFCPDWVVERTHREWMPLALREGSARGEGALLTLSGKEVPVSFVLLTHRNAAGEVDYISAVARDISERKQAEEKLSEAHAQLASHAVHLEKLVEERTLSLREMISELQHLSYAITHDMRAPLRAMNTFASLLLEEACATGQASPAMQDYCRRIMAAAGRLDKLIQDSLNYTKTVLQELPLQPVDLADLIPSLIATYPNLQADKAEITIEDPLPVVLGEESRLTQCFSNLLGNAVKFVAHGVKPRVRIRVTPGEGVSRIWIEDNGIGIPAQAQDRLFGMFQRLTADYEGTGIGLAIVRKVVERMGGKVGVESKPGNGSRFWVELQTVSRPEDIALPAEEKRPATVGGNQLLVTQRV